MDSDALVVCRWCWPCCEWKEAPEIDGEKAARHVVDYMSCKRGHPMGDFTLADDDFYGVNCAERVLIERGLAEAYGRELVAELGIRTFSGGGGWTEPWAIAVHAAAAPLDARIRALAAVVRAQEGKK